MNNFIKENGEKIIKEPVLEPLLQPLDLGAQGKQFVDVDAVFTPHLDSYLPGLLGGLSGLDSELREFRIKCLT